MEGGSFDIDLWLSQHIPDIRPPVPYKDGRKWELSSCLFNPDHNDHAACVFQLPNGAVAYKCMHNSCQGNDWRKLRALLEPGCYGQPKEDASVDISGLVVHQAKEMPIIPPEEEEQKDIDGAVSVNHGKELFPNPGELPENLTHIPGFIDTYTQWMVDTAPYPNRVLSFCASLAFLAFITGRTVRDERDNRTNIYLVALANSGTGKDHPRKCNARLALETNLGQCIADEFGSGEGLEDSLFLQSSMLYQVDEFDTLLNSLRLAKDTRGESIIERLLRLYGTSNSIYPMRRLALRREERFKQSGKLEAKYINNPHLAIFGTAIPKYFYQSLSPRVLSNGLAARCLVLDAGKRGHGHKPKTLCVPPCLMDAVKVILDYGGGGNLTTINPAPITVKATEEADKRLIELNEQYDNTYDHYEEIGETTAMTFWARAFEKVCKLALLYAISCSHERLEIDVKAVEWASSFVDFLTRQMLFLASTYSFENEFDEKCQKILRYLSEAGKPYPHGALLKRSHESRELFKHIMDTLVENGSVELFSKGDGIRSTKYYRFKTTT